MIQERPRALLAIGLILLVGLSLRCINVGFGLPGMYDPDEPLFVLKAYTLLDKGTLNPHWFGHPGTTTIYLLALVDVIVVAGGLALGVFTDIKHFAASVYADPGLIFLPSRLAFVLISVGTIWLTYLVGRRLFDRQTACLSAAFLALNALHIAWSQVIRTDIHSSFFMLASMLWSIHFAQEGRLRQIAISGLFIGFALATKWPGGSVAIAALGAILLRAKGQSDPTSGARSAGVLVMASLAGLFVASPYIFLDWSTVASNVSGEVVGGHLGHTGRGLVGNLAYYLGDELAGSMGWIGLFLIGLSVPILVAQPIARLTLLPTLVGFLILISAQSQIWSRWLTPALPLLSICAAVAATWLIRWSARRIAPRVRKLGIAALCALVLLPSAAGAVQGARERANDPRRRASVFARAHIPAGSTVAVEHLALDLRSEPWRILFPMGAQGCIDGAKALTGGVRYEEVQKSRRGSSIVDLGNVEMEKLGTCHADFAILTYYDMYLAEAGKYPREIATYRRLLGDARTIAIFRPGGGPGSGPVTRVVALKPQFHSNLGSDSNRR